MNDVSGNTVYRGLNDANIQDLGLNQKKDAQSQARLKIYLDEYERKPNEDEENYSKLLKEIISVLNCVPGERIHAYTQLWSSLVHLPSKQLTRRAQLLDVLNVEVCNYPTSFPDYLKKINRINDQFNLILGFSEHYCFEVSNNISRYMLPENMRLDIAKHIAAIDPWAVSENISKFNFNSNNRFEVYSVAFSVLPDSSLSFIPYYSFDENDEKMALMKIEQYYWLSSIGSEAKIEVAKSMVSSSTSQYIPFFNFNEEERLKLAKHNAAENITDFARNIRNYNLSIFSRFEVAKEVATYDPKNDLYYDVKTVFNAFEYFNLTDEMKDEIKAALIASDPINELLLNQSNNNRERDSSRESDGIVTKLSEEPHQNKAQILTVSIPGALTTSVPGNSLGDQRASIGRSRINFRNIFKYSAFNRRRDSQK